MDQKELAPEIGNSEVPKIRLGKDGTKKYYFLGMLHRDPKEGPAIEVPGKNIIGDCYLRGVLLDEKWYQGRLYQCLEDVKSFIAGGHSEGPEVPSWVAQDKKQRPKAYYADDAAHGGEAIPRAIQKGIVPAKAPVNYLPMPDNKPKHKDRFNKLSDRVRGGNGKSLQDLYNELIAAAKNE